MVGCYIWYSEEGTGRGRSQPSPLLAVPDVTTLGTYVVEVIKTFADL